MGFPTALSAGNKTTLRTPGYWQRTFIAFNPGETVFQCRANEIISDAPFKQFAWDNTQSGAYTDVLPGMVVYISSTATPFKDYKYRGRVRLAPSATIFYIDLNATTLADGDYVTVIRDADLFARVREVDSVDGSVTYHNLPPMITGLPSVLALYDSDNDGNVSYAFTQSGVAVANGASISSWLWSISGTGTTSFTAGTSTSQNPTIQFQAGYHYLVRCRVTDSNGIQHYQFVQVYAITRTFTAPVILPAVAGSVSQDLDNGYSGSITAYSGVSNLPYRTHAAVFCVEHFGDGSSTPMVTNVLMHGRLRSESITTQGSEQAGVEMQVTYPIEGITSYLQRLKVPNDMVRHAASPDAWGEMVNPTPYRMAVYFLYAYTTLLNLVSFNAGDSQFAAWRRGDQTNLDGGYALDTLKTILAFVDAAPNYAPDGEIRCEINASAKVDRSALTTIMDFTTADTPAYTLDIDTSSVTGQVIGYGGSWNSTANSFTLYMSNAPTIPYSDAPESRELTRLLLKHDITAAAAATELAARTGNDYAINNPKWLMSVTLLDSHRWLVATNYQRYTFTLAATDNTRGITLTTATKFQCQSVDWTINPDGSLDVTGQFPEETEFTDAQAVASLLPDNLAGMNPVLPALSDDPAFPDDPLWMFPTDTPVQAELPAIDPYSDYLGNSPFPPAEAADAAKKQGTAICRPLQVNFKNSGTVQTGWSTEVAAGYTIHASGDAQLSTDTWVQHFNFTETDGSEYGWVINTTFHGGVWVAGTGWTASDGVLSFGFYRRGWDIENTGLASTEFTGFSVTSYDYTKGTFEGSTGAFGADIGATSIWDILDTNMTDGTNLNQGWAGSITATALRVVMNTSYRSTPVFDGSSVLKGITVTGKGTNPFGGATAGLVRGDAFYYGYNDEAGGLAQVYGSQQGLRINSTAISPVPPFDPSHKYAFQYTGDGNPVVANFQDTDYSDNSSSLLDLLICRNPT